MIKISVIVPCRNEIRYIDGCVESILNQDFPHDEMEVLFVDGMSTDGTRNKLIDICSKYSFCKFLDNPQFVVPTALNIGIKNAQGDVIMRLDAHTFYKPQYISTLYHQLFKLNADNVGCVCKTDVIAKTPKSLAIKCTMSSLFGVGNSNFRTGVDDVQLVDTVPFGCYRREVFNRYGLFDERLARNQDIEFNKRIVNGGGQIYLIPETLCTYYSRDNFRELADINYANGFWNIMTVRITRRLSALSLRHFIPMLFVLSLLLPSLLMLANVWFGTIALMVLVVYFATMMFFALRIVKTNRDIKIKHLACSFIIMHVMYGYGSLIGLFALKYK